VRYLLRVLIERNFPLPPIKHVHEIYVQNVIPPEQSMQFSPPPVDSSRLEGKSVPNAIKMEVGIEECLHIEFQYQKKFYHLNDYIEGFIHFLLVRIKIKYMEIAVIRREISGLFSQSPGSNELGGTPYVPTVGYPSGNMPASTKQNQQGQNQQTTESQTLLRYEIMDGAPVKGETIPVKLYLSGIPADLTPTFDFTSSYAGSGATFQQSSVGFSVRYYLNLVLVDEEDRRYFKQQEIILWRKELS
jgi:vacuolar protein sorting-associated protein 26